MFIALGLESYISHAKPLYGKNCPFIDLLLEQCNPCPYKRGVNDDRKYKYQ